MPQGAGMSRRIVFLRVEAAGCMRVCPQIPGHAGMAAGSVVSAASLEFFTNTGVGERNMHAGMAAGSVASAASLELRKTFEVGIQITHRHTQSLVLHICGL